MTFWKVVGAVVVANVLVAMVMLGLGIAKGKFQ